MGGLSQKLTEYFAAFRRRRRGTLLIAGTIFSIGVLVALLWPPIYSSTATILIEEQDIPTDLVRSTVTTYAWQRIQTINQRVMTRATLLGIIDKYGLYADKRERKTNEEILARMRSDIRVAPISADVIDPRSGRPTPATIAFTLTFESNRPDLAQRVASELTSLYLNENLKSRTERAEETYNFLTDEASRLSAEIAALETKLARYKERNVNNLPELANLNLQLIERAERDLLDTQTHLRSLEERRFYLEGQLAQLNPASPVYAPTGERVMDPATRLKTLKTELAARETRYSGRHPDIVRLRHEIEGLEKRVGSVTPTQEQARELTRVRGELASTQEKYAEDHPDVLRLRQRVEGLETALAMRTPETKALHEKPDNPAYISLQAQLEGIHSEARALEAKRQEISRKLADYERRVTLAPQVEKGYLKLKRDHDNAQLKYREIKAKQMEAQVGQQLEKERKGERFSLIDPPQAPEQPSRPNRKLLFVLGIILSVAGGFGYLFVAESLDSSVRSPRALTALIEPPLSVVPYVENGVDAAKRRFAYRLLFRSGIAAAFAVVLVVQFFWIPWDVLWFKALRVLGGS